MVLPNVSVVWRSHDGLVDSTILSTSWFKQSFLKDNYGQLVDPFSVFPVAGAQMMDCDACTLFLGNANKSSFLVSNEGVKKSALTSLARLRDDKPES